MADYSKKEALDRIVRVLLDVPAGSETPDTILQGDLRSENKSVSDIAKLLEDTLSGEDLVFPAQARQDYGEVWTWTGTVELTALPSTAYTKITGTFQNSSYADGITCQPTQDRLLLTRTGYYFVDWQLSFQGSSDIAYKFEPYHAALGAPQAAAEVQPSASGSAVSISGCGIFIASGISELVDLRMKPSATAWLVPRCAQLRVLRMHKQLS